MDSDPWVPRRLVTHGYCCLGATRQSSSAATKTRGPEINHAPPHRLAALARARFQTSPTLARCRLVVRSVPSGAQSPQIERRIHGARRTSVESRFEPGKTRFAGALAGFEGGEFFHEDCVFAAELFDLRVLLRAERRIAARGADFQRPIADRRVIAPRGIFLERQGTDSGVAAA